MQATVQLGSVTSPRVSLGGYVLWAEPLVPGCGGQREPARTNPGPGVARTLPHSLAGMPRIPIRTEPYSTPSKQRRHFKNKRDQVLRTLGKAAYINGSQFAILLVSSRGEVETYASDALQGRLDDWFVRSGIASEARELAQSNAASLRASTAAGAAAGAASPAEEGEEHEETASLAGPSSAGPAMASSAQDPFLGGWSPMAEAKTPWHATPLAGGSPLTSRSGGVAAAGGAGTSGPQHQPLEMLGTPYPQQVARMFSPADVPPQSARPGGRPAQSAQPPAVRTITLRDEAARTAFLELRFTQLQQMMCKMVAKTWIKVIEPKKQTRWPYIKGEEWKPSWWPADVRHKEPDHLMKPERHRLLLGMLRCGQVRVARLQLATAELAALIKAGKVTLLMDIYRVAREEERIRDESLDTNTPVSVTVSTTEGWDVAAGRPLQHARDPDASSPSASSERAEEALYSPAGRRRPLGESAGSPTQTLMPWTPTSRSEVLSPQQGSSASGGAPPRYGMTHPLSAPPEGTSAVTGLGITTEPPELQRTHSFQGPLGSGDYTQPSGQWQSSGSRSGGMVSTPAPAQSYSMGPPTPLRMPPPQSPMPATSSMRPVSARPASSPWSNEELRRSTTLPGSAPGAPAMRPPVPSPSSWGVRTPGSAQQQQHQPMSMVTPEGAGGALPSDSRMWSFAPPMPGQPHGGRWPLRETPLRGAPHMTPGSVSMGTEDVPFSSPSFDTSFSGHSGPMTPGTLPHFAMAGASPSQGMPESGGAAGAPGSGGEGLGQPVLMNPGMMRPPYPSSAPAPDVQQAFLPKYGAGPQDPYAFDQMPDWTRQ